MHAGYGGVLQGYRGDVVSSEQDGREAQNTVKATIVQRWRLLIEMPLYNYKHLAPGRFTDFVTDEGVYSPVHTALTPTKLTYSIIVQQGTCW